MGGSYFRHFLLNLECVASQHTLHYLPVLGQDTGLGHELQQGYEESQGQAQPQEEEEAVQVGEPKGVGRVGILHPHTAAGPPLVSQVGELPWLAELQDGHGQVFHQRGT